MRESNQSNAPMLAAAAEKNQTEKTSSNSFGMGRTSITGLRKPGVDEVKNESGEDFNQEIEDDDESNWEYVKMAFTIAADGDLAGYQIAWGVVSIIFLCLKIAGIGFFQQYVSWTSIFLVPIANALFTGIFDGIIKHFHDPNSIESMIKKRFFIPFTLRLAQGMIIFTLWLYGGDGIRARFKDDPRYSYFCAGYVLCIWMAVFASLLTTELMITTVLVASEQNLVRNTPPYIRVILCVMRPIVWVYNRAMGMFICFHCFYGLIYGPFVAGAVCDLQCNIPDLRHNMQSIGLQMLTLPFTVPWYLFSFSSLKSWTNLDDAEELTEMVILMFLVLGFWIDISLSILVFLRRFLTPKITEWKKAFSARNEEELIVAEDGTMQPKRTLTQKIQLGQIERHKQPLGSIADELTPVGMAEEDEDEEQEEPGQKAGEEATTSPRIIVTTVDQ